MTSTALDPIDIKTSKFFYPNGTQFFLRGVSYFSWTKDFLADDKGCLRDVPALVSLGINVLHVAGIDPSQDHKTCIKAFMEKGIYLLIGLPTLSTDVSDTSSVWTNDHFDIYTGILDVFAPYTNTLGFYAVDNVINDNESYLAPQAKAAVRDMKNYIEAKGYRSIPVGGYSDSTSSMPMKIQYFAKYMACGYPTTSNVDFWGLTDFSWCTNDTFKTSDYSNMTNMFSDYPVPIFIAGYNCADYIDLDHTFDEVGTIYGPEMSKTWSGGITYEWLEDPSSYEGLGLVDVVNNTVEVRQQYRALSTQLASINPSATQITAYMPTITSLPCPTQNQTQSWVASMKLSSTANHPLCDCMVASLRCKINPSTSSDTLKSLNTTLCSQNSTICEAFVSDGTTGTYGAFSACSLWQQLSWSLNQYLNTGACSEKSKAASIQTPAALNSSCSDLLTKAGPLGQTPIYSKISLSGSTSTVTDQPPKYNSGTLPGKAITGIVVGVLLAVIAAPSFIFLWIRKRKQQKSGTAEGLEGVPTGHEHARAELGIEGQKSELWANYAENNVTDAETRTPTGNERDAMLPKNHGADGSGNEEICEMP